MGEPLEGNHWRTTGGEKQRLGGYKFRRGGLISIMVLRVKKKTAKLAMKTSCHCPACFPGLQSGPLLLKSCSGSQAMGLKKHAESCTCGVPHFRCYQMPGVLLGRQEGKG